MKAKELLSKMTLEEKASLCSGLDFWHTKPIERLNIPAVMMADGPHGLRKEDDNDDSLALKRSFPATCFPTAVTSASSWDPDLLYEMGGAIAEEARAQGIVTVLGPGTNIKRSPLGGRNFEYFSEDPYLSARLTVNFIKGVEDKGIGTSLKHYAVNSQEYMRMSISEVLDERTFREIYLPAFEYAVKESQPATIMCSYNRINGVFSSDNKYLLTDILRDEWDFKGIVVSDWGATNNRVEGIRAGLDLEMPSSCSITDKEIVEAVTNNTLDVAELDKVVERMLVYILKYSEQYTPDYKYNYKNGHDAAIKIGTQSAILLKNEDNILPLNKETEIAVIGELARKVRYQGSGSSLINPKRLVSFTDQMNITKQNYSFAAGYTLSDDGYDAALIAEAVNVAKNKKVVVLFLGLTSTYESEGYDRSSLDIPQGHAKLLEALSAVNKNIVTVLVGGSPVTMPWLDNTKALINMYLAGEAAGEIYYKLIFGEVCPSGKLAETYPLSIESYLGSKYYRMGPRTVEHREGIFVGYRYYDTAKKDVLFPFGYGLSYTTFEYSDFALSKDKIKEKDGLTVSFKIKNTGKVKGAEIAQVYVKDIVSTIYRPDKELKGFKKVWLEPDEENEVTVTLDSRAFAYYNVIIKDWHVESGDFEILVGASSRDILWSGTVNVKSSNEKAVIPDYRQSAPSYYNLRAAETIGDSEFIAVCGAELPLNEDIKKGDFDLTSTIYDIRNTFIGKLFLKFGMGIIKSQVKDVDMTTMLCLEAGFKEVPVRAFPGMTKGLVSRRMCWGLIDLANGKFFRGVG
ncbi:MAG: glycosyl hydrolase, partial [Clostridia bacterium]|nr:glycosyl hydrolase [Clostridia bacterium]